jgi:hypothetical protein
VIECVNIHIESCARKTSSNVILNSRSRKKQVKQDAVSNKREGNAIAIINTIKVQERVLLTLDDGWIVLQRNEVYA